ncbi:MAG: IS66 Orf2 like protein [Spirochaetes bacterium ADurb.Bin110]|nr:MAG: IS66 Orf2 like protein [Spirochaetes bacterium ADurb.Bin110]
MVLRKSKAIYLVSGVTDMRKQITGLASIIEAKKPGEIFSGNYFVFLGKSRRVMKIIYWDKTGFCMWQKRLEEESFPWTRKQTGVVELEHEQFKLLLKGIDIFREHRTLHYEIIA